MGSPLHWKEGTVHLWQWEDRFNKAIQIHGWVLGLGFWVDCEGFVVESEDSI